MTKKFLSNYKHKTVFISFWVAGTEGVANKLQELNDTKNQGVYTWHVIDKDAGRYVILVELNTWVKRKKKK